VHFSLKRWTVTVNGGRFIGMLKDVLPPQLEALKCGSQ